MIDFDKRQLNYELVGRKYQANMDVYAKAGYIHTGIVQYFSLLLLDLVIIVLGMTLDF
jgi:hypothetical protein